MIFITGIWTLIVKYLLQCSVKHIADKLRGFSENLTIYEEIFLLYIRVNTYVDNTEERGV